MIRLDVTILPCYSEIYENDNREYSISYLIDATLRGRQNNKINLTISLFFFYDEAKFDIDVDARK